MTPQAPQVSPQAPAQDYDDEGKYARAWLPELKNVPAPHIHEPWKMNQDQQKEFGCIIGQDYPAPMRQPRPGQQLLIASPEAVPHAQRECAACWGLAVWLAGWAGSAGSCGLCIMDHIHIA